MQAGFLRSSMPVSLVCVIIIVVTLTFVVVIVTEDGEILTVILLSPSLCLIRACLVVSHKSEWRVNYHNWFTFVGGVVLSFQSCFLEVVGG